MTHMQRLRNTCKRQKYPSIVNCRGKINPAAVNYRGFPRQLTTNVFLGSKLLMRPEAHAEAVISFSNPVMCFKHKTQHIDLFFLHTMVQITKQNWRECTT